MAMTKDDLREIFAELLKADDDPKNDPPKNDPPKKEEPKPSESNEELKALEARLNELETELKEKEKNNDNPATKDPVKTTDDEDDEKADLHNRIIAGEILKGVSTSGFDEKVLKDVMELFAYDKLKGEDGSADDEKIATLVDALTSLALREPPTGGGKRKAYDPADEGLAKYL